MNDSLPKKWLILTQYYAPETGAPQVRLRAMAQQLQKQGFEVEVLTGLPNYPTGIVFSDYEKGQRRQETIDGVPVRRVWLYAGAGRSALVRLGNYLSFTLTALFAALRGPKPDLLFIESQPLTLGLIGLMMKWLRGVPYVYNIPDLQIEGARELQFGVADLLAGAAAWLERRFIMGSWTTSTVTQQFVEYFVENQGIPRDKLTFLPNAADAELMRPLPPDELLLETYGLAGKQVVVYVGTHAYYHGLDTLIDAARLLQDRENLVFLMMGDGAERPRLEALAQDLDRVIFGGTIPYEDIPRYYSIATLTVATLRNIGVAQRMRLAKIFPAMSCEVPVVYSGVGEAAQLIAAHETGLVVAPEDPAKLADAIARLLDDPAQREHLGRNGRQLVETHYNWTVIVEQWLASLSDRS